MLDMHFSHAPLPDELDDGEITDDALDALDDEEFDDVIDEDDDEEDVEFDIHDDRDEF